MPIGSPPGASPPRPPANTDVLRALAPTLGTVPHASNPYVCETCLGPVSNYARCYGCKLLTDQVPDASIWRGRVVPMTSALNPGTWYTWLSTYKTGHPERRRDLGVLAYEFMRTQAAGIAAVLGGAPSVLTIVPSKRGREYADQPLQQLLHLIVAYRPLLRQTLRHLPGQRVERRGYNPAAFAPVGPPLDGARVVLVEDTWVTGATALSAAGALYAAGADRVLLLPIARLVDSTFWKEPHPYRDAMKAPYRGATDPAAWPR